MQRCGRRRTRNSVGSGTSPETRRRKLNELTAQVYGLVCERVGVESPSTPVSAGTELSDVDKKEAGGLLQQALGKMILNDQR